MRAVAAVATFASAALSRRRSGSMAAGGASAHGDACASLRAGRLLAAAHRRACSNGRRPHSWRRLTCSSNDDPTGYLCDCRRGSPYRGAPCLLAIAVLLCGAHLRARPLLPQVALPPDPPFPLPSRLFKFPSPSALPLRHSSATPSTSIPLTIVSTYTLHRLVAPRAPSGGNTRTMTSHHGGRVVCGVPMQGPRRHPPPCPARARPPRRPPGHRAHMRRNPRSCLRVRPSSLPPSASPCALCMRSCFRHCASLGCWPPWSC